VRTSGLEGVRGKFSAWPSKAAANRPPPQPEADGRLIFYAQRRVPHP
jgi:hypothetical protein